jgi:hypothetical protein
LSALICSTLLLTGVQARAYAQSTEALTPGTFLTYTTIHSIGIEWDITGDTDHDAVATVEYRVSGSGTWKGPGPLLRVDYEGRNMLAGSLMFLDPATAYDLRVTLSDPDGGAAVQQASVQTSAVPAAPLNGRVLHVMPGAGGGDGSPTSPFLGIAAAQLAAQPGDTFLLHAGSYAGRTVLDRGGAPAQYIVWKAVGDGEVALAGVDVNASYVWLEGVTIRDQAYAVSSGNAPVGVVIRRSSFLGNHYAILLSGGGSGWYIADNTIVGDTPAASGSTDGEGIDLNVTNGHTVAHNLITNVGDGVSYPRMNVDIFGNDIFDTSDDGIELDFGLSNVRVWGNRIHNAVHNAISFQPQSGGPWYIVRNQIVGSVEAAFKFRTTDRFVLFHNTIVHWGNAWPGTSMLCCNEDHLLRAYARNNLWISVQGGQIWGLDAGVVDWRSNLDYDGFDWGAAVNPFAYGGVNYPDVASFSAASGLETNGVRVFWQQCFESLQLPGPSPTPVPPQILSLRAGCNAIDAGAVVPNLSDSFAGVAPDLGAHERERPAPLYGPRPLDTPELPPSWSAQDVGAVGVGGTATVDEGRWTVRASGADIWGTSDQFGFIYQTLTGDGTIVARVASIERVHDWVKAGVMIRATLAPDSPHASMFATPGANGLAYQRRIDAGGATLHTDGGSGTPPVWVALMRTGNVIQAFRSDDGVSWTWIGGDTIPMPVTVYIGLAVTSHNTSVAASAEFDGVHVQTVESQPPPPPPGGLPPGWSSGDIGAVATAGAATASGNTWTVSGSGADVWGSADEFRYAYRAFTGDGAIVARVASIDRVHDWAKAGVMVRATLEPGSPHASLFATPGLNGLAYQRRIEAGGATLHTSGGSGTPPVWVALMRTGSVIQAFRSDDGVNWTWIGGDTIQMPATIYVGVAVSSHADGVLATATFEGVEVRPF